MPRDPKLIAGQRLDAAVTNWRKSKDLEATTRSRLDDAIVAAVKAGIPRYEVAKRVGVSAQHIGTMPGVKALKADGETA